MFANSLAQRVDVTLSLTIASQIVDTLSKGVDSAQLAKFSAAVAGLFALWGNVNPHTVPRGGDAANSSFQYRAPLNAFHIFRRLSVLVVVQVLMREIRPVMGRGIHSIALDLNNSGTAAGAWNGLSFFAYIPLSVWPLVEGFVVASLALIAVRFSVAPRGMV